MQVMQSPCPLDAQVRTEDLEIFLSDFCLGGIAPYVRWVDDNHALAVFPSAEAAAYLLESPQRTYKARRAVQLALRSCTVLQVPLGLPCSARISHAALDESPRLANPTMLGVHLCCYLTALCRKDIRAMVLAGYEQHHGSLCITVLYLQPSLLSITSCIALATLLPAFAPFTADFVLLCCIAGSPARGR